jgi:DNA ligase-associated metallophosphoesterase
LKTVELDIKGNKFVLYPQKGILWVEEKILLISDLHIGKTAEFRSLGIPVPGGTTSEDLNCLTEFLKIARPIELVILGDMLHSRIDNKEKTFNALKAWRIENDHVKVSLIKGNHDKGTDDFFKSLRIELYPKGKEVRDIIFSHQPVPESNKFVFAGHIHPAVRLSGMGRMREHAQCFYFSENFAILPSFGSFTGNYMVKPKDYEKIFVIAGDEVIEVKQKE